MVQYPTWFSWVLSYKSFLPGCGVAPVSSFQSRPRERGALWCQRRLGIWSLELLVAVMAEKGDSSDEEPTIAEDVVVTKYKMAGDMANSKLEG